jgi:hypothetical protein
MQSNNEKIKYGDQFLIKCTDNNELVCPWFIGSGIYRLITDIGGIPWTIQPKDGEASRPVSISDSFLLCSTLLPTAPLYLHAAEKSFFDLAYDSNHLSNNRSDDFYFAFHATQSPGKSAPEHLTYDCEFQIRTDQGKSSADSDGFWAISDGIIVSTKGSGNSWQFKKLFQDTSRGTAALQK